MTGGNLASGAMKTAVTRWEVVRTVLIVVLAIPFARNAYRPVDLAVPPAFLALFAILVLSMVHLWTDRPRLSLWRRVFPLILCMLAPYVGAWLGHVVEHVDFRFRRQNHYRHVVEMLERGELPSENGANAGFQLPHPYEGEANGAAVTRDGVGGLRVEFRWSRHSSYVYCKENACTAEPRWKESRRINEEWLFVKD